MHALSGGERGPVTTATQKVVLLLAHIVRVKMDESLSGQLTPLWDQVEAAAEQTWDAFVHAAREEHGRGFGNAGTLEWSETTHIVRLRSWQNRRDAGAR